MKKKFEPWEDAKKKLPVLVDVEGPPCVGCIHWNPVAVTGDSGLNYGVRLCHAPQMHRDFSCYCEKKGN